MSWSDTEFWQKVAMLYDAYGIYLDAKEMAQAALTVDPLDENLTAYQDVMATTVAGILSGEFVFWWNPYPDHMDTVLFAANQDVLANGAEAVGVNLGHVVLPQYARAIDFFSSLGSLAYDTADFFGHMPNYVSAGVTVKGMPVIIVFPQHSGTGHCQGSGQCSYVP
jgi:hypothetical protein